MIGWLRERFGLEERTDGAVMESVQEPEWLTDWYRSKSVSVGAVAEEHFAVEASAGLVSRAFALATVSPAVSGLSSGVLATIGRELVRRGESVWVIDVDPMQGLELLPSSSWDISGGARSSSWRYRVDMQGPSRVLTARRGSEEVIHPRINVDPKRPYKGQAPYKSAKLSADVLAQIEKSLSLESKFSPARVVPYPYTGDDMSDNLRQGLHAGGFILVSTAVPTADAPYPSSSLEPRRIGPEPDRAMVDLRTQMVAEIFGVCGCPAELFGIGSQEGSSAREAMRRWLHSTLLPWAEIVSEELSVKLDRQVSLGFDRLMASDLSGRARAFQSMVNGGMEVSDAARLAGLMQDDEA